ncbi:BlaI/MecI/CopY family transcriptional regulator [Pelotomaculum terephthalicicum JT]|uniref:BlaI/MecI/CopY family transcriptional regulator n=1 Tax=Pelotomaculum terephthalicicum TaxID=206393 RepID=UPI0009C4B9A4|nr:BlaI/MecI/CopY family transcriptional regulator [Pelotomaculum terephthalicicum]MCG9969476.1 BlaI/MecI/CopY family transcriptional regulator [Pelotomaculum terephthalicicum JT]OPX92049.1 MAG: Penicillinase repressor [Pelotomaculum sp. PtaB.Bin104]OPY60919.1 MAG: Penicillinase repressor [Pelotomaculum sp. PtaU1.Bin065]
MTKFQKLSETEMEVMQIIWESDHPVTSGELLDIFARSKGKEWKGQTIATFLARLVEKGVLNSAKQGRANTYTPRISPEEYRCLEAQSVLDMMYEGSVKNFLAALYDGKKVTRDELAELKQWLKGR